MVAPPDTAFRVWLFGLLLSVAVGMAAIFLLMAMRRPQAPPPFDSIAAHRNWVQFVQQKVGEISAQQKVDELRQVQAELLTMKVAPQDKQKHLLLALALQSLLKGDASALARLQAITHSIQ